MYLPAELLEQIFQFLPLEDYPNISLSNKQFFSLVRNSFLDWSRNLLARTLNSSENDQASSRPLISASYIQQGLFEDDLKPQNVLRDRMNIQREWNLFSEAFLPVNQKESLIKELVYVLRNPTPPFPCLKRDTQCFKTNSMFQNFLTEVYFELTKKYYLKDKRSMMIEKIVDNFKKLSEDNDAEDLAQIRWSLFNTEIETELGQDQEVFNKNIQENSMKKRIGNKTKKSLQFKIKKYRQKRRICQNSFKTLEESAVNRQLELIHGKANDASKLFKLIYLLAQNHCQMVRSYMTSIQDAKTLLSEYIQLWETYVMVVINFDEIFSSLSDYASQIYSKKFDKNTGKFPIWKLMIKAWTNEVFLPLSACLAQILCSTSYGLRNKKLSQSARPSSCGKVDGKLEKEDQKVISLVQEVYNAISDLSYNEMTVFFSECASTNPQTPKYLLDSQILNGIMKLYKRDELLENNDSKSLKSIFENDVKLAKELFGRELKYQLLDLQSHFMKDQLLGIYNEEVKVLPEVGNLKCQGRVMNFKKIYSAFEINQEQVQQSKACQVKLSEEILKECPLFEDFVDVIIHLKEALQVENYKSKQRALCLLQKGFCMIQEERCPPFQGGKNKKIGNKGLVKVQ